MKAIIWGAAGQDGYYLTQLLKQRNIDVIGVSRSQNFIHIDSTDFNQVGNLIKEHKPQYIFHFAANSTTQHSAWQENHNVISTGTMNILQAVKEYSPDTKVFLSGSGLQFKNKGLPIRETDPFEATSIYAVSRIHTVYAARYYRSLGLKVYVGYFFNHDSPGRSERHINKKIINAAELISKRELGELEIGNLSVKKEFGFSGDIVEAVWLLVNQDKIYETVIGTGKAYSIKEWIEICFSMFDLDWKQYVVENSFYKPEYEILVSDPTTIFSLGWHPKTSITELAKMMR